MLITVPQIPINSRLSRHREKCPLAVGFSRKQIRSLLQEFCFPWTSDFQLPRGSRRIVVVKLWNFATTPVPPHSRISRIISVVDQKDWQSLTGDSSLQYVSFYFCMKGSGWIRIASRGTLHTEPGVQKVLPIKTSWLISLNVSGPRMKKSYFGALFQ